jgi:hypothetical protein
MESPATLSMRHISSPEDQKRKLSVSDPPPYHLHEIKSLGDVTFTDPWNAPLTLRSDALDSTRIAPSKLIGGTPGFDFGDSGLLIQVSQSPQQIYDTRRLSSILRRITDSELFWLAMYFLFNLGLTLYNKIVLVTFPFPYTLTAMHALCGSIGCYMLQEYDYYVSGRSMASLNVALTYADSGKVNCSTSRHTTRIQCALCCEHRRVKPFFANGDCPSACPNSCQPGRS